MNELIPCQEIAVDNEREAMELASILLRQDYVVMVSREEDLFIVNYIYSEDANRNDVVFMDRESYESNLDECVRENA